MNPELWSALRLSLAVAALATVAGMPSALGFGWLLARTQFRAKALLTVLLLSPAVLPPVVTGYLLLRLLGRNSAIGAVFEAWGIPLSFSFAAAVLAAFVVSQPFYILGVRAAFESVSPRYEELAACFGHRPWRVFLRITMPLAAPGILAGAALSFARGLGEFGATIVLAGNRQGETRTLALAIYSLLDAPGNDAKIALLTLASLCLALAALAVYELLLQRHRQRLGLSP